MNKYIRTSILLLMALVSYSSIAQQQPQYTQFTDAKIFFNPAYTGTQEGIKATMIGRWQWVGFEGAPNTQAFSLNTSIPGKNIGLGLVVNRDQIAITNFTSAQLNYAYGIQMGHGQLSMGISGNLNTFAVNYDEAYTISADPNFSSGFRSSKVNFGMGLYYSTSKWYAGGSIPSIVNSSFEKNDEFFYDQKRHYYLTGGYKMPLNELFTLEPNLLIKMASGSPLAGDLNVTSWYRDVMSAGISYRSSESIDFIFQFKPRTEMKIGYAFDLIIDPEISELGRTSHEVLLAYAIPVKNKDTDNDGVVDKKDECPLEYGSASNNGCPEKDSDGDGVPDAYDACVYTAGLIELEGCPDKDGDGLSDKDDQCPNKYGTLENFGCPDTDGDGVVDSEDLCPENAGSKEMHGCPDEDGDGIIDINDKCPNQAGHIANQGCPEISKEVQQVLDQALEGVQFESGGDVLTEASYGILDNLVKVMSESPSAKLRAVGYTDSFGDDQKNLKLSENRAMSVKRYLSSKGIAENRIEAIGKGESNPIADNSTPEGRSKNRRVEFSIYY